MDSLKTPKFSENTENGEARRRNPPPPIYRGKEAEDFFGSDEKRRHPATSPALCAGVGRLTSKESPSPADHVAEIGDMMPPPNFGPGETRTNFVLVTTTKGVVSFDESGAHPRLNRESSGAPEGLLEVQHTPGCLARFHTLGLPNPEALAARLAHRDRDLDDRQLCVECRHLAGHAQGVWRCANWPKAGMVGIRTVHAQLPPELVTLLQRCDGFSDHITPPESTTP